MNQNTNSSRRKFLQGGVLLTAPIAAASAVAMSASASADDSLKARLARLEDEAAIRKLHESWLRQLNAQEGSERLDGTVRRITTDQAGAADRIEIAASGASAVATFDCAVEQETPLAANSTLAQMAHAQGFGSIRQTERRVLSVDFAKQDGRWSIRGATLRAR